MRTIIHLSDLHFGRTHAPLVEPLLELIRERAPHLVVLSGDITQRATIAQFKEANRFVTSLSCPVLAVPGNHDIPLYTFWNRLFRPYSRYRHFIANNLEPRYQDNEMLVVGLNSSRALRLTEGQINKRQRRALTTAFAKLPEHVTRIIVTHHPMYVPLSAQGRPFRGARKLIRVLDKTRADMMLAGHLHSIWTHHLDAAYKLNDHGPLIVQSGTTLSTRLRANEPNSFNIITLDFPHITIERYQHQGKENKFHPTRTERFTREENGWVKQ